MKIEIDEQCPDCGGTGLYIGMPERNPLAKYGDCQTATIRPEDICWSCASKKGEKMKGMAFSEEMSRALWLRRKTVTRRLVKPQPFMDHHWTRLDGYEFHHKMLKCQDGLYCKFWHYLDNLSDSAQWIRPKYQPGEVVYVRDPPLTMRKPSRLHLRIVDVRPERIQDITEDDAEKEGVSFCQEGDYLGIGFRVGFKNLADKIYPGSWERNDWVWRYELEEAWRA